jgi:omega-3 fatty acid desaturase (delta-15 desaturase)
MGQRLNLPCNLFLAVRAPQDGSYDLSAPPPFTLQDLRNAIPAHCWEKKPARSMAYLALDVAIVAGLAAGAYALNAW